MRRLPAELFLVVCASLLFIPFLGQVHLFDWDEINFAEASREMLLTGNYAIPQIDFQPFWEKPPLFFWLQAASMKIFGVNEFAARFPNAICGIVTMLVLFRLGSNLTSRSFGIIWAAAYAASLLPQLYFKSGIIDPWFNLFIFLGAYYLARYTDASINKKTMAVIWAGLFAGLAMMTKGPVALLILGLCYAVFAVVTRFRKFMKPLHILLFLLVAASVGSIWFLALWINGQGHIVEEFMVYQVRLFRTEDAGHGGPFFYHFVILLVGCFPAAVLAIMGMRRLRRDDYEVPRHYHRWMLILFWVTLILFSIVKTKIVHYSSLAYFPLTYLAAVSFYFLYKRKWKIPSWAVVLQVVTGLLLAMAFIAVSFTKPITRLLLAEGKIRDEFTKASLQASPGWSGWEFLPGALLLISVIFFAVYHRWVIRRSLVVLFLGSLLAFNLLLVMVAPRVEPYSQGAAIEFYKTLQGKKAVTQTLGFKSYAHLFYTRRPADYGGGFADSLVNRLAASDVEVFIVGKIQNQQENMASLPLQPLYQKNGFVFYRLLKEK